MGRAIGLSANTPCSLRYFALCLRRAQYAQAMNKMRLLAVRKHVGNVSWRFKKIKNKTHGDDNCVIKRMYTDVCVISLFVIWDRNAEI